MPLVKSASKAAVGENIRRERAANVPQKQAVAVALNVQRAAKKPHKTPSRDGLGKMARGMKFIGG